MAFVSRAGLKLDHALTAFDIDVAGLACADLGCNAGGVTDCLLQRRAAKVYAVDPGSGALEYKLGKDARVVVMERTNAMHVTLPEPVDFVCVDVAWTRQRRILPAAHRLLSPAGRAVVLIKPHYEADRSWLVKGILPAERVDEVVSAVTRDIAEAGFDVVALTPSPIRGGEGNAEVLAHLVPRSTG